MTEQKALKYLKDANRTNDMICIFPKSDISECIIKALEEVQQYRTIGTVEECRAAVEEQTAKKPNYDDYHRAGYRCPDCNNVNPWGYKHCKHCGQKLDWRHK